MRPDILFVQISTADPSLEHHGVDLVRQMVGRLRAAGIPAPTHRWVPYGPDFSYADGRDLFCGRSGIGPLHIAWDTNLLSDYFDHGRALWRGEALPENVPGEQGDELEGLQILMALWVVRDIRFHVMRGVLSDANRGKVPEKHRQRRARAFAEFAAAISYAPADDPKRGASPRPIPAKILDAVLDKVPAGNDRDLVRAAVESGMHVFLTRDKGILSAQRRLAPFGLRVTSPQGLLDYLISAGALHCLVAPERYLMWPMPDQHRVAHLVQALPAS